MTATENNNHPESSTHKGNGDSGGEDMADMIFTKRGCCFWFPCFGSDRSSQTIGLWERIQTAENEDRWWTKGCRVLKKMREWSELVAGPKWKTFIRKFNKNNQKGVGGIGRHGKFNYDPLSYALNFDEGPGQNGFFDEDFGYPDFSSRYASIPVSCKSSMDLGKDGPSFT